MTPADACVEYLRGYCEYTARCANNDAAVLSCVEMFAPSCPDLLFAPGSTRTLEGTFACADEWRVLSCDVYRPACATPGTRLPGEACISNFQCESLFCNAEGDACGECVERVGVGAACDVEVGPFCDVGLSCDSTDSICVEFDPGDVDPTGSLELGDECDVTQSGCYPNDCAQDDQGVYRCRPYPSLGQDCSEPLTCAFGDSYCDITQVCLELPGPAEPCGVDGFTGVAQWCGEGLLCDRSVEPVVCRALPGAGEPCEAGCQEGLSCRCDDDECVTSSCKRLALPGDACGEAVQECVASSCMDGSCVPAAGPDLFAERCEAP